MLGVRQGALFSCILVVLICIVWFFSVRKQPRGGEEFAPKYETYGEKNDESTVFPLEPVHEEYAFLMSSGVERKQVAPKEDVEKMLAERFRLVTISFSTNVSQCCVFIETLSDKTQAPYAVGAPLGDVGVISQITRDGICVKTATTNCWLNFGASPLRSIGNRVGQHANVEAESSGVPGNRFGITQGSSNEWSVAFGDVIDYFDELKSRPERLEQLFDTFEPVYNGKAIQGYKINIKGEEDFLKSAGLAQGDFVKSVNYIQMNNRWQAERLIEDVVSGKKDFLVFEIERNGKIVKQNYHVQQ